ncbi:MAG: 50S ribosomal protein L10 [Elusimicrobia bacterium RIFCSPLOWO2_01_FULL_64_13]|nr:MAG: 50S ribosomal protein L10 [Elusimicrobia bacterium RIFCSPHIGHO2_01_FULL_64_10]OGR97474.1 MAG: 50S ribosomal protein L10 [Elusimicrobia bacterium RIFCSPLOWO2_01_FULL_64_13]
MPNQKNVDTVRALEEKLKNNPNLIVTSYQGLPTTDLNELREKLSAVNCRYGIVKNTLTRIALKNIGLEAFVKYFTGPTAVAFQKGDPSALSKILVEFAKKNEKLKIVAGCLAGKLLTEKEIGVLASLPSREALLGILAGTLNAPIQRVASVLAAPVRKLAMLLKALEIQKGAAKPA